MLDPHASIDGAPHDAGPEEIADRRDLFSRLTARADGVQTRLRANQRTIERSMQLMHEVSSRHPGDPPR